MATQKKKVRKYSDDDLLLIARMENTPEEIKRVAAKLKRTPDAIRLRKWQLEHKAQRIQTQEAFRKEYGTRITDTSSCNQRWSKEEEELVLNSKLTDFKLAEMLKRTLTSVAAKRCRLLKERKKNGRKKR